MVVSIQYGVHGPTGNKEYINSNEVSAVIFPCTDFEQACLISELLNVYDFYDEDLRQSLVTSTFVVDYIRLGDGRMSICVEVSLWRIKGVWVCFVGPTGNIFSYVNASGWVREHFSSTYGKNLMPAIFTPENFNLCVGVIEERTKDN